MSDNLLNDLERFKSEYYSDNKKNTVFKAVQKTDLANRVCEQFGLEDLFVRPDARGSGLGKALLGTLAGLAVERDCARLEWSVLDWNTPAIDFYKALGATPMDEWTVYRVDGSALNNLAAHSL